MKKKPRDRAYRMTLGTATILFFVTLAITISTRADAASGTPKRLYTPMATEQARQLTKEIIKKVPPHTPLSSWRLPETGLKVDGVKINDKDYIIVAQADPAMVIIPQGNLPELLPQVKDIKKAGDPQWPGIPWWLNGILYSTVDIEIVDTRVILGGWKWAKERPIVSQGGYRWYIGQVGILLFNEKGSNMILVFPQPLQDFSTDTHTPTSSLFDLSIARQKDRGMEFKIAGNTIRMR